MGYESGCEDEGVEHIPIRTTHYPTHYSLPIPTHSYLKPIVWLTRRVVNDEL